MAEEAVAAAPPTSKGSQPQRVVLVVDDEDGVRDIVCRALRAAGFRALEAAQGAEALELIAAGSEAVDLVITDVVMPGLDGRELGRRLGVSRPDLPVLYMSAYDVNDIFRRGSPSASAPFLQKPFTQEILLTQVEQLLKQPAAG
ncbi:MAG TPA: response regulator [Gemmatimonadales bacterium]|nr:response regulator [Gemmatimonadales bacterium]